MKKKWDQLLEIMEKLRGPDGCPWDQEQNHVTLIPYLIEESYEVIDAIEKNNTSLLKEELGDLLLQIIFHAQIAKDNHLFNMENIIEDLSQKLIRRHPHVFQDKTVSSVEDVNRQWEKIKEEEKKSKNNLESHLDSIPKSLPSLFEAYKLGKKASQLGFDWDHIDGAIGKLDEELSELKDSILNSKENIAEEMGDLLFSITNICRHLKIKPELALRKTNLKFRKRFTFIEKELKKKNKNFNDSTLEELDALWDQAKKNNEIK